MTSAPIATDLVRDLYTVFNALQKSAHAVTDLTTLQRSWNSRYVREMLGLLMAAGLAVETEDQHGTTYESYTWEQAEGGPEAAFRAAFPGLPARKGTDTPKPASKPAKMPPSAPGATCKCGCGQPTSGGTYRPGHDARHVSQVVKAMVAAHWAKRAGLLAALPTDALRAKAQASYDRKAGGAK